MKNNIELGNLEIDNNIDIVEDDNINECDEDEEEKTEREFRMMECYN